MDQITIPIELTKVMPTYEAIRLLKFDKVNNCGLPSRDWGAIEVSATPYMGNWVLSILTKQHVNRH